MALVVPAEPLRIDQRWSEAMQDIRTPLLTGLALVFNTLGRGWALSLTAVGVVLYARRRLFALLVFAASEAPAMRVVNMRRSISVPRFAGRILLSATEAAYAAQTWRQGISASGNPYRRIDHPADRGRCRLHEPRRARGDDVPGGDPVSAVHRRSLVAPILPDT